MRIKREGLKKIQAGLYTYKGRTVEKKYSHDPYTGRGHVKWYAGHRDYGHDTLTACLDMVDWTIKNT
jgi:hypothetical protein